MSKSEYMMNLLILPATLYIDVFSRTICGRIFMIFSFIPFMLIYIPFWYVPIGIAAVITAVIYGFED